MIVVFCWVGLLLTDSLNSSLALIDSANASSKKEVFLKALYSIPSLTAGRIVARPDFVRSSTAVLLVPIPISNAR